MKESDETTLANYYEFTTNTNLITLISKTRVQDFLLMESLEVNSLSIKPINS